MRAPEDVFPISLGWLIMRNNQSDTGATIHAMHGDVFCGHVSIKGAPGRGRDIYDDASAAEEAMLAWSAALLTHPKVQALISATERVVQFAVCVEECDTHKHGPDTCSAECGCEKAVRDARSALYEIQEARK